MFYSMQLANMSIFILMFLLVVSLPRAWTAGMQLIMVYEIGKLKLAFYNNFLKPEYLIINYCFRLDAYVVLENMYCSPGAIRTNWASVSESKQKCSDEPNCYMFFDSGSKGTTFKYCSDNAPMKTSTSGSTLYQSGN